MPKTKQLVALCLRHGQTSLNDSNCFRSWLDVPLDDTGIEQAHEAADFLSKYAIRNVISSPLLRAFVTASTVATPHNLSIGQTRGLFPWHLGLLAGLSKDDNQDALRLFVENPDVCIPSGESLNDFEDRQFAFWNAALKHAQDSGLTLFVAHTSNIIALQNFTDHSRSLEPEDADTVKPGGIVAVYFDGTQHHIEPIFGQAEEAVFGGS